MSPGERLTRVHAFDPRTWTPHWVSVVGEPAEIILIVGADGAHEHLER